VKLANVADRLHLTDGTRSLDVHTASDGRFGPDPQSVYAVWSSFTAWAHGVSIEDGQPFHDLGPPVPRPQQVFAIGLNYTEHAAEAGYPPETMPVTFTKFPTCLTGPHATVDLPSQHVDWEVELVVVISHHAWQVPEDKGWDHIAGVTIGQDLSERDLQLSGTKPQFSLGKSFPGFGPTGPFLVTPDELANRDDLEITATLTGETVQASRTSRMIYPVPTLVARLSSICPLLPGDLIFTGTPAGVGNARTPKRFLTPEDTLVSAIEGLGEMTTRFRRST
jgi:2-keto-4-pentenoate hydratase/2-oxohepta-3-ene-1,7-dioic acid hydratase in catechol pathway